MNTQPKLTIIRNTVDQGSAIDVLRILHQHLKECEELVLNLPLREYEIVNTAVEKLNVRNTLTKTKERLEEGINTLLNAHIA